MSTRAKAPWKKIEGFKGDVGERVTLYLSIYASPMSFGWADAFAVADCWRDSDGRWVHLYNGSPTPLQSDYVTHFAPSDAAVKSAPDGSALDWWRG